MHLNNSLMQKVLTLFPGGPVGPVSPVGPGEPYNKHKQTAL